MPRSINMHSNAGSGSKPRRRETIKRLDAEKAASVKNQNLHDVSFKAQHVTGPIPQGKPRLETLPASVLVNVCKFLKAEETVRLACTAKKTYKRVEEPEFDNLWVLISFQTMFSKTGITGIRNAGKRHIDEALHQMHF